MITQITKLIPVPLKRWLLYRLPVLLGRHAQRRTKYTAFQASTDEHYGRFVANQMRGRSKSLLLDWLAAEIQFADREISVLDVGCGPGALLAMIQSRPELAARVRYTGVDQAEGAIRYAERTYANARFFRQDVIVDGLPEGKFDVIAVNEVIEHIEHYAPLLARVREKAPSIAVLCTFAALPEYKKDRRLWRPDTQCFMNSYAFGPLNEYMRSEFGGEVRVADFGTHQLGRYWFPIKGEIMWYCRRPAPIAEAVAEPITKNVSAG